MLDEPNSDSCHVLVAEAVPGDVFAGCERNEETGDGIECVLQTSSTDGAKTGEIDERRGNLSWQRVCREQDDSLARGRIDGAIIHLPIIAIIEPSLTAGVSCRRDRD